MIRGYQFEDAGLGTEGLALKLLEGWSICDGNVKMEVSGKVLGGDRLVHGYRMLWVEVEWVMYLIFAPTS